MFDNNIMFAVFSKAHSKRNGHFFKMILPTNFNGVFLAWHTAGFGIRRYCIKDKFLILLILIRLVL